MPVPVGPGRCHELLEIGFAGRQPALPVAEAHAPFAPGTDTPGHRAGRPAEHRIARVEYQVIGAELRADSRHQLARQSRRTPGKVAAGLVPVWSGRL